MGGFCFPERLPDFAFEAAYGAGFSGTSQNPLVCNVDPSLSTYPLTFGVTGYMCQAVEAYSATCNGTFNASVIYTGLDNQVTTATAPLFTILDPGYTTIYPQFTDVPYTSIAPDSPVTLSYLAANEDVCTRTYTYTESSYYDYFTTSLDRTVVFTESYTETFMNTNQGRGSSVYTQDFSSTVFFAPATTTTSTTIVPSLSTTTSTVTNTGIAQASTTTVTVVSGSGTATSYAHAATITSTKTIHSKARTKTIIEHRHTHVTKHCLPPPPHSRKGSISRRGIKPRQQGTPDPSYVVPYCGTPLEYTTYYSSTVAQTSTVTSGVSVETDFAMATVTSTYTPTAFDYKVTYAKTKTITKTLTAQVTKVIRPPERKTRRTITFTATHYPPHATRCHHG